VHALPFNKGGRAVQIDFFSLVDLLGVVVFAFVGTLKGVERHLDVLGITVTGVATALGGGIIRDVLVNRVPMAITDFYAMLTAVAGVALACLVVMVKRRDYSTRGLVLVLDALGLAAFTATGAMVAWEEGLSLWGVLMLGALTGCGGGAVADLLCNQVPGILREDFYAICCLAGAFGFFVVVQMGYSVGAASFFCNVLVLVLRLLAIFCGWRLPRLPCLHDRQGQRHWWE